MTFERFIPTVVIISVALLLVLIGVFLMLRQRSKKPAAHQAVTEEKPAPEWVKGLAGSTGRTLTRTPSTNLPVDAVVVMRDAASTNWVVEINGMRYTSLKEVHDDRAASKVLAALSGLQAFAGIAPAVQRDLAPVAVTPTTTPAPAANAPKIDPSVARAMAQSGLPPSLPQYPAPPNSILAQIETILQRNLSRSPELGERRIHMGAAADGSLLIEVDRQFYHHVDEIADVPVRDFVQAAIQEWERTA